MDAPKCERADRIRHGHEGPPRNRGTEQGTRCNWVPRSIGWAHRVWSTVTSSSHIPANDRPSHVVGFGLAGRAFRQLRMRGRPQCDSPPGAGAWLDEDAEPLSCSAYCPASAGSPKLRGACPGAPSSRGERAAGGRATRHRRHRPGDLPTAVAPSERTRRLTDPSAALRGPFPWGDPLADGLIGVVAAMGVPGSQDARSAHPLALEQERLGESQRL